MGRELSDGVIAIQPLRSEDAAAHLAGEDAETARWLSGGVSDMAGTRRWIRGRGYMPRALGLLEGFLKELGLSVAVIRVDAENKASLRVPPRCGFVFRETITSSQGDQLAIWYRRLASSRGRAGGRALPLLCVDFA